MKTRHAILSMAAAAICSLILCSCAGVTPLTAERPADEAFRTTLKQEPSTLNIPVETSTDEMARVLNRSIRTDLYRGSTGTLGLAAAVTRTGPIAVSAADNFLYVTLPVAMTLSYSMFETQPIPLKLKFKVKANVSPDWRLHVEIYYLGLSDLLAEEVGIGPLKLKPRSIVDSITQPVERLLADLIVQQVNNMFPLKAQVLKVWNTAQQPILLDKRYNAWLELTPREVLMYPLSAQNNRIRVSVGISTFAQLVVGPKPASRVPLPLPNLKLVNTFDKTFRVALNADLYYKDLLAIAGPLLINKTFDSDGKSIVIKGFDLYGNGDRLIVRLETQGSLDGVFYLTAKPVFDPQTNTFSVEDVDFDMQTKSLLLRSADWFLHGAIRDVIRDKLNMNLTTQLEQTRQMADKALARVPLVEHAYLQGNIKGLKFNDVLVQKDKLSIQVYTEGESAILFQ